MRAARTQIAIVGEIMLETWGQIPHHTDLNDSTDIIRIEKYLGGMGVNTAIALAGFGWRPTIVSCIGENVLKPLLLSLRNRGVSVDYCYRMSGRSPEAYAFFDEDGYRHYYCSGTNFAMPTVPRTLLERSDLILLSGGHQSYMQRQFYDISFDTPKAKVVFNPSYAIYRFPLQLVVHLIETCAVLALNRQETTWLCHNLGITPEEVVTLGPDVFIHTQDSDGCDVYSKEEKLHMDAISTTVVNTVGAGDAFLAGFLVPYIDGEPLELCVRMATAVAYAKIRSPMTYVDAALIEAIDSGSASSHVEC